MTAGSHGRPAGGAGLKMTDDNGVREMLRLTTPAGPTAFTAFPADLPAQLLD